MSGELFWARMKFKGLHPRHQPQRPSPDATGGTPDALMRPIANQRAHGSEQRARGFPNLASCRSSVRRFVRPFAPGPLQTLRHYYDLICRHHAHPFSRPRGIATCAFRFTLNDDFPFSMTKPPRRSCRLYAGFGAGNSSSQAIRVLVPAV